MVFFTSGIFGDQGADAVGDLQNHTGIGVQFSNSFGDISLNASAGWEGYVLENCGVTANLQNCENNPESKNFGATISSGEWSIGASWLEADRPRNNAAGGARTREDWDVGISWRSGPLAVGLMYGEAQKDVVGDLAADPPSTDTLEIAELNGSYVIGPGIDFHAAITSGEFDDASPTGLDNDFTEFKVGAALWF